MKQLRPYQQEGIDAVINELTGGCTSQLFVCATGLGKTFIATKILNNEIFKKVLWLTHTEELIDQSAKAILNEEFDDKSLFKDIDACGNFIDYLDALDGKSPDDLFDGLTYTEARIKGHIGIVKQHRMDVDCKIVVASIQTMVRRLDKMSKNQFDLIICDEAHLAVSNTWSKTVNYFNPKLLLGLTATPTRSDGMSLSNLFDKIVFERDIKFGIENGYLCEIDAVRIKTEINIDAVHTLAGDLNTKELESLVNTPARNNLIVDKYLEYATGRQALVFCVDVKHAMDLAEAFVGKGVTANFVVGDESLCPDRKERVQSFRNKEVSVLTNVNILTAGVDIPDTNCIIAARPTKSLVMFMQSVGRGTRLKSDGGNLLLLDIVDNTSKHALINTWTLDSHKKLEDTIFITKAKKAELIEKRENKRKLESVVKVDVRINLLQLPEPVKPMGAWTKEAPSEKQLEWLVREGYDIVNNSYSKGQCAEIIGALPATKAQLDVLKRLNYDISAGVTRNQAGKILGDLTKEKETRILNKSKII